MHKKPERREEENLKFNAFLLLQEWLPAETTGAYDWKALLKRVSIKYVWLRSYNIKHVHDLTNDL